MHFLNVGRLRSPAHMVEASGQFSNRARVNGHSLFTATRTRKEKVARKMSKI